LPAVTESPAATAPDIGDDLPEQMRIRREKLDRLRAAGVDPYPLGYPRTATLAAVADAHPDLPDDHATGERVGIAGRVMLKRVGGKLCFATLRDGTGDLQVMLSLDRLGQAALDSFKHDVDLGDHLGVTGEVITSRRGELSVMAESFAITSKCLRPLPEKHKGLSDPEARVRQRYVDLIVNPESRDLLRVRSAAVRAVRESLQRRTFVEVETPMLQVLHGGANARPFVTHINAYDMPMYLRIAPELYLKRLLVGGVEKVFEINRNFRNEGADSSHNPEFTMLEMYEAYGDYDTMRVITQELIQEACVAVYGDQVVRHRDDDGGVTEFDISGDWPVVTVNGGLSEKTGEEITCDTSVAELQRICDRMSIPYDPAWGHGMVILEMYEHLLEDTTVAPVFYADFPTDVSPLTRQHRDEPRLAERWDLVAFGAEIATAYSELIDPVEQRARLTAQSLLAAGGNEEAMQLDEDFLRALEYGMPPAGGQGMGIERLLMMLTGRGIRDTLLFPLVKPE
jgi:lysyl-tRNA synthetase class 2